MQIALSVPRAGFDFLWRVHSFRKKMAIGGLDVRVYPNERLMG